MYENFLSHIFSYWVRNNPRSTDALLFRYIREGAIVPVEITVNLLKRAMEQRDWEHGKFLIDGFPRNEVGIRLLTLQSVRASLRTTLMGGSAFLVGKLMKNSAYFLIALKALWR